jgi:YHS domain-containing protein
MRRVWAIGIGVWLLGAVAWAGTDPVNKSFFGDVVLKGYDAVAYFENGAPLEGSSEFSHAWNGATWRFSSAAHRDRFAADPERYAPQYGGYCGYAVSQGFTAPIDPAAWSIVGGKLYLNYDPEVRETWNAKQAEFIQQADQNWPRLLARD